jgi:hypothetical protein
MSFLMILLVCMLCGRYLWQLLFSIYKRLVLHVWLFICKGDIAAHGIRIILEKTKVLKSFSSIKCSSYTSGYVYSYPCKGEYRNTAADKTGLGSIIMEKTKLLKRT